MDPNHSSRKKEGIRLIVICMILLLAAAAIGFSMFFLSS